MKRKIIIVDVILLALLVAILSVAYFTDLLPWPSFNEQVETAEEEPVLEPEDLYEDEEEEPPVEEEPKPITLCFTGDVEISSYVQANYDASGIDGVLAPQLQAVLSQADVTMVNNEFCYSLRGQQAPDKLYTFRVNPSYVSLLTDMGVDVAGLANNHVLDYGKDALVDTFSTLEEAGIEFTGSGNDLAEASKLVVKEVNGTKIGYLAASRVIPVGSWNVENSQPGVFTCYDYNKLVEATKAAKESCDYVFVMVHWGVEHTDKLEDHQLQIGHALVDAGADGVIGMHSHCLQPIEYYNGVPIFYSLGNFIFNRNIGSTAIVELTIENNEVGVRLVPAAASDALTYALSDQERTAVFDYLESISQTVSIDEEGRVSSR